MATAAPLLDVEYEEIISHRSLLRGSTGIFGWAALPFAGPVRQIVQKKGGGALLRTASEGLWSSIDANATAWTKVLAANVEDAVILLEGAANAVAHAGGISILECGKASSSEGGCHTATLVAKLDDPACAQSVTSGSLDASSGQIVIGCSTGLYLGTASGRLPQPLARDPAGSDCVPPRE